MNLSLPFKLLTIQLLSFFKSVSENDPILIFSDPRGGGTWLTEMLSTIDKTAIIWEPLNIRHVREFRNLKFGWRQYIPEDAEWEEAKKIFSKMLIGKLINEWTCLKTGVNDYWNANQFIIKICRGHMLLPWLVRQFNFSLLPIYLVRHPFAVVASQLKHKGWHHEFSPYKVPSTPYNQLYSEHEKYLESLSSKEERLTAIWCITNSVPLNHKNNNSRWITLYYENLALDTDQEMNRIFARWQKTKPDDINRRYIIPSSTTSDSTSFVDMEKHLRSWERTLTESQIHTMSRVLEYFNITTYCSKSPMPQMT